MFYVVNFPQFLPQVNHCFPILARGLFPKLLDNLALNEMPQLFYLALIVLPLCMTQTVLYWNHCINILPFQHIL